MKQLFYKSICVSLLLACFIFFYGCGEEEENEEIDGVSGALPLRVVEYMVDASSKEADVWTYFSFASGGPVTATDPATSTGWDLAFHRLQVQVNCGTSGPGKGGAKNMGVIDFDSFDTAPTSGYVVDTVLVKEGHGEPVEYSGNPEIKDWYNITKEMPPVITSKNEVFAVKTADGKYAKMQFLDYYDKEGISGFVTIKYVYQPDGSPNLK
ncbi:TPA: hypothetical protein EYP66_02855 [Candidatus Poribacteria bacterium]|nr:hypothetical protein [Candidatus Poribacteria bacterium]